MELFKGFNYQRYIPIIFRLVELTFVVVCFLLSRYGGLFHLGADPPLNEAEQLRDVGAVPWGADAHSNNFGEFVLSSHLYALSILLCADLSGEPAPLVNLIVNLFGAVFFLLLAAIQFNAWPGFEETKEKYRQLTGFYPFWHEATVPRIMAFIAMLIGMLLVVSAALSLLIITQESRSKKVRFHKGEDAARVGDDPIEEERQIRIKENYAGGIAGSLGVQEQK